MQMMQKPIYDKFDRENIIPPPFYKKQVKTGGKSFERDAIRLFYAILKFAYNNSIWHTGCIYADARIRLLVKACFL
jgi:hypothetical protein